MDDIQDIVSSIVRGCNHGGQEVSEILAAFVAKTVRRSDLQSIFHHVFIYAQSFVGGGERCWCLCS